MLKKIILFVQLMLFIICMLSITVVAKEKKCAEDGCNSYAINGSKYCYYHSGTCVKEGCTSRKYCGSYCAKHDNCKDKGSCKTANYGGRKICKNAKCGNTTGADGYCPRHSKNVDKDKCFVKSCNNKKTNGSYCTFHYNKLIKNANKTTKTDKKANGDYDIELYDTAEDFADDWEDDFDSYDDAYDYYMDNK